MPVPSSSATVSTLLAPGRRRAFLVDPRASARISGDPDYTAALYRADMLLPDGPAVERVAPGGVDLLHRLLGRAARQGKSVFLLGRTPGAAEAAALAMMLKTPGLRIAGTRRGCDCTLCPSDVIESVNASGADILLVSLRSPDQEIWLDRHGSRIEAPLQMAVGAAFDAFVRHVTRSPRLLQTTQD